MHLGENQRNIGIIRFCSLFSMQQEKEKIKNSNNISNNRSNNRSAFKKHPNFYMVLYFEYVISLIQQIFTITRKAKTNRKWKK